MTHKIEQLAQQIALLERGSRVMSAIHKRCYYAMKKEFKALAKIFSVYLPPVYPYSVYGADRIIKVQDFDDRVDVIPVADPNVFSMAQRVTLANENFKDCTKCSTITQHQRSIS
jgi:hypothetical protein